jgi:hypothetical protein
MFNSIIFRFPAIRIAFLAVLLGSALVSPLLADLEIVSDYGDTRPKPGGGPYTVSTSAFYAEGRSSDGLLNPSVENIRDLAKYRAVAKGYSITYNTSGKAPTNVDYNDQTEAGVRSVEVAAGAKTFTWKWKVQNRLFIEIDPLGLNGASRGDPPAEWYDAGETVPLQVNGKITTEAGRYRLYQYEIENDSVSLDELENDTYWSQNDGNSIENDETSLNGFIKGPTFVAVPAVPAELDEPGKPFTIDLWLRTDRGLEEVLAIKDGAVDLVTISVANGRLEAKIVDTEMVASPAGFVDGAWHHWALTYNGAGDYRLYRDGQELAAVQKGGTADPLKGMTSGAAKIAFSGPASLNNVRFWNRSLDSAALVDSLTSLSSAGKLGLIKEWTMDGPATAPGEGYFESDFNAEVLAPREKYFGASETPETLDNLDVVMSDWRRVIFRYRGEVRYRFDAMVGTTEGVTQLNNQPFVRTEDGVVQTGSGPNIDIWIPTGSKVDVGCFYRTPDRCFTLSGIIGSTTNDLANIADITTLIDTEIGGRLARVYTVESASLGSEIHWQFQPTVFRAEIPIGKSFDPLNPNAFLIPALCDDAILKAGRANPAGVAVSVGQDPEPSGQNSGGVHRWDSVAEVLFPVAPGTTQFNWPHANRPGVSYKIELVSGFPGAEVPLVSPRENGNGRRQVTQDETAGDSAYGDADGVPVTGENGMPLYFFEKTTLPDVDNHYPGAPGAHYRHLADKNEERRPPLHLDPNSADRWFFKEKTFHEDTTEARIDAATKNFTAVAGGRSVLLYSYRPNPAELANGDDTKELLAVRVVRSEEIAENPGLLVKDRELALGLRSLSLENGFSVPGPIEVGESRDSTNFSIDFWLKIRELDQEEILLKTGDGGDQLTLTLDPATGTLEASYLGLIYVTHPLPPASNDWHHYTVHVFQGDFFGFIPVTFLQLYVDGASSILGMPSSVVLPDGSAEFSSLDFESISSVEIDQFRVYNYGVNNLPLSPVELNYLSDKELYPGGFAKRLGAEIKASNDFETDQGFGNAAWKYVNLQEVAGRFRSTLDRSGFGSGYILNEISNYNANLYDREADIVGTWGPIFPVNHSKAFDEIQELEVAYYENPYRDYPDSNAYLHPNVDWPYIAGEYNEVTYPEKGPHRDKAIYIASRIGTEGVDRNGSLQQVFDLEHYADLTIYNQGDDQIPGYNPNEEHALVAPANRAALKIKNLGEDILNNPSLAAFALQKDINVTGDSGYTSDPWVLVQVNNLETDESEMAAYQVEKVRLGTIRFPRPSDTQIAATIGLAYEATQVSEDRILTLDTSDSANSYDFSYAFSYSVAAGDLLIPPYPVNLVIGNVAMSDSRGKSDDDQQTLWWDVNGNPWAVSGNGIFYYQYFYPFRADFFFSDPVPIGTPVAWLPDAQEASPARRFTSDGDEKAKDTHPGKVFYLSYWRTSYPKLKRGETLTYQGGDYFNENPGSNGLPALVAMKAAEIVFDDATPSMIIGETQVDKYSARIIRPLDRREVRFEVAQMDAAGFSAEALDKLSIVAERWYFRDLPGSLGRRFYYDSLAEKLVFRGYLNDKDSVDPDLTSGPDPLNILEPNVMTPDDFSRVKGLSADTDWSEMIEAIYNQSVNPSMIRNALDAPDYPKLTGSYLAGMKESPIVTERLGLITDQFEQADGLTDALEAAEAEITFLADLARRLDQRVSFTVLPSVTLTAGPGTLGLDLGNASLGQIDIGLDLGQIALSAQLLNSNNLAEKRRSDAEAKISSLAFAIANVPPLEVDRYSHLNSFGVGSALVCNPSLIAAPTDGSRYITVAENNRLALDGAPVSLHIIEIIPDRYSGAIKVVEAADPFSEKVNLLHNGDFGANTDDLYYEWWIRDAAPLDVVAKEVLVDGSLKEVNTSGQSLWQQYIPERSDEDLERFTERAQNPVSLEVAKHLGLHTIVFEGRPDVTLADKLVLMRYRHYKEPNNWKLVPFEVADPKVAWKPGARREGGNLIGQGPAPFQWAGAANSPQLQADGSKRYIPQLVMGWIKRVLDRINPYEARYTDFFGNESPAVYSSQIQIAGAPFVGEVALNPDKNVIENVGLIELYETILQRARELSTDNSSNPQASEGINQALLLAATRLSVLYELLAREAYSDAQDSTITVTDDSDLKSVASFTHAFQNMEADLMHEELALLRGTDFLKSYPVYNRIFWNYAKGLGEAAYNVNYNIYDENTDGFINEDDARALYPQGHGDSWGHFLSSVNMHYELLQHDTFSWKSRSELYSLMENVLEVDYLDEKSFAQVAAARARTGRDIVRATYRQHYTQDPDGQWQGYTDGGEPARAWGVSEWAHRAGQASHFDWAVANALLPANAEETLQDDFDDEELRAENLDRIQRSAAEDEIGEIAGGLYEIQIAMDEANGGVNPLGFVSDTIAFDLDLEFFENASGGDRRSHFEQIYTRALVASTNAKATLDFAAQTENKLRHIADDTDSIIIEAFRQDLDYRNRLIEIFGRPYDGTIGFGKAYPEGYEGPDTILYSYLDRTTVDKIAPPKDGKGNADVDYLDFEGIKKELGFTKDLSDNKTLADLYSQALPDNPEQLTNVVKVYVTGVPYLDTIADEERTLLLPVRRASDYAFQAESGWGQRTSYGRVQQALESMLLEEMALKKANDEYIAFLGDFHTLVLNLANEIKQADRREILGDRIEAARITYSVLTAIYEAASLTSETIQSVSEATGDAIAEAFPTSVGFSNDVTSAARAVSKTTATVASEAAKGADKIIKLLELAAEITKDELIAGFERDGVRLDLIDSIEGLMSEVELFSGDESPKRNQIGIHLQQLEIQRQAYITALAEGSRLMKEREAFNKVLAANVQKNRYQDMIFRLSRNEAMSKYQSSFNNAARYAWLAAKAYDYETSLDSGNAAAPGPLLDQIVKERQLGLWTDGEPQVGQGGLAEILAQLNGNFQVLKGQLGINNPQSEIEKISLRSELFRIMPASESIPASDDRWKDALNSRIVEDLTTMPEFTRYCRPFSTPEEGAQPGIVIRFSSQINSGVNFFGNKLAPGDHKYSTANFATKIRGFGVWLENYNEAGLVTTPRAYLVPVGNDYLRTSSATESSTRVWNVMERRIPTPFVINQNNLTAPGYIPTLNGVDGGFGQIRRHGDFRMYHDNGDDSVEDSELTFDSRLIGRSVWNSEWLLIIPGAGLDADPTEGLRKLSETITDIKLHFKTYSHQGQ